MILEKVRKSMIKKNSWELMKYTEKKSFPGVRSKRLIISYYVKNNDRGVNS